MIPQNVVPVVDEWEEWEEEENNNNGDLETWDVLTEPSLISSMSDGLESWDAFTDPSLISPIQEIDYLQDELYNAEREFEEALDELSIRDLSTLFDAVSDDLGNIDNNNIDDNNNPRTPVLEHSVSNSSSELDWPPPRPPVLRRTNARDNYNNVYNDLQ